MTGTALEDEILHANAQPNFCMPFVDSLPIDGAVISTLGPPFEIETVSASGDIAARLSEVQLDVGEGPAWDAYATSLAVLLPDLTAVSESRWPLFAREAGTVNVHSFYSFPLAVGTLRIGAVDLFAEATDTFSSQALANAELLAAKAATRVLRHALEHKHDDADGDGPHSRREVHQATGMVIAQMGVEAADALMLIRAHAFATGKSVRETAADITARRITLSPDQ